MTDKQLLNAVRRARTHAHRTKQGFVRYAQTGKGTEWKMHEKHMDAIQDELERRLRPKWLDIGPVVKGQASLLDQIPTHPTSGIPLFIAFDTAWGEGKKVENIAPEDCVVDTKDTSSSPGEAMFLTGVSGLRYWVGHLEKDHPLGTRFKKGQVIGRTLVQSGTDHAHWGVNVEAILGKGNQLLWGGAPDKPPKPYQLGSPSIRSQLITSEL